MCKNNKVGQVGSARAPVAMCGFWDRIPGHFFLNASKALSNTNKERESELMPSGSDSYSITVQSYGHGEGRCSVSGRGKGGLLYAQSSKV